MKEKAIISLRFSIAVTILWAIIFLMFINVLGFPEGAAVLYSFAYALGHASEFGLALLIALLICSVLPKKIHSFIAVLLSAAGTAFFAADLIIYKQFRLHLNGGLLSMFFGKGGEDIFVLPMSTYLQAFGGLALIVIFMSVLLLLSYFFRKHLKKVYFVSSITIIVAFFAYHAVYAWANFKSYHPVRYQVSAIPFSYPLTMNRFLRKKGFDVPDDVPSLTSKVVKYPLEEIRLGEHENLNVVIIAIDAWRQDAFTEEISPNIYEFAQNALRFRDHNAASNHTRHGIFTLFYGIPGAYWANMLADKAGAVLVNTFIDQKYELGIFASATLVSPEFNFTVFANVENLRSKTLGSGPAEKDRVITEEFLDFLSKQSSDKPFFSFLFYDSTHSAVFDAEIYPPKFTPYEIRGYISNDPDSADAYFNLYKNSAGYIDVLVKRVLDAIKDGGFLDNTIVIITGDHGEEFNDLGDGFWGHNGNFSRYQTMVPLVVYWPGKEAEDITYKTSHMDIVPTLMQELFNTSTNPDAYTTGTNLFLPEREYIYMHGASDAYGILQDGIITVFPVFGSVESYDADTYKRVDKTFSMDAWREILQTLSRYKK